MNPARFKSKLLKLISHVELINRTHMPSRQPAEQNIPTSWPVKDFGVQDTFIKTCRKKVERIAEDDLFVDGQFMSEEDMVSENMKEYLRLNSSKPGPSYQLKLTNIVKIKLLSYSMHAETKNNHVSKTQFMLLQVGQMFEFNQCHTKDPYQCHQSGMWKTRRLDQAARRHVKSITVGNQIWYRLLWTHFSPHLASFLRYGPQAGQVWEARQDLLGRDQDRREKVAAKLHVGACVRCAVSVRNFGM